MKKINLAIVIPTLNEEHYIGKLLDSIAVQSVWPSEIVIVDAFSPDGTITQIKKRQKTLPQLRYYQIPKDTISKQRNLGAKKTKSDHILFLDADTFLLDPDTLKKYYQEVLFKESSIAVAENLPLSEDLVDRILFGVANLGTKTTRYFYPLAVGVNMYIKRRLFKKLGGFNEKIRIGEDCELVQRYAKKGVVYTVLDKPKIYTSVRRLKEEGRMRYITKAMQSLINERIHGYRKNTVKYEFGNHPPHDYLS